MTRAGWRSFLQRTPLLAARPALALAQTIALVSLFWTMQALWFPMHQQRASLLIHVAVCAAGARALAPLACALRSDPSLSAAAARVCEALQVAKQLGLAGAGGVGAALGAGAPVCAAAPVEMCIVFSNALGFVLPFYFTWVRSVALRARFNAERAEARAKARAEARELRGPGRSSGGGANTDRGGGGGGGGGISGVGEPGATAAAAAGWLDAVAAAPSRMAVTLFAGVSLLLGTLVTAEAIALFGPPMCAAP
ncbi:MAG: hypothetical protein J3K34DRAFT_248899 [Monoraphidium minutum]|nr:MAG: hypothetical protein J3K34DRAFT_248899 [Monoraphidium minutum]